MLTPASPRSHNRNWLLAEIGTGRSARCCTGSAIGPIPFMAILEGEVAIIDAPGDLNLLSAQTLFVNALVTEPLGYIAVERGAHLSRFPAVVGAK